MERLLPLCEYVHVIKRFVETRSQIQYPMVVQVSSRRDRCCMSAGAALLHPNTTQFKGTSGTVWHTVLAVFMTAASGARTGGHL